MSHQNINMEAKQLGHQRGQPTVIALCPSELEFDILTLDVTEVAKTTLERKHPLCVSAE